MTLMNVSSVGDLPQGGVHPVGVTNGSGSNCGESLNQCFSLNLLLNKSASRCMIVLSVFCVGCGQYVKPRLKRVFSSSVSW